MTDGESSSAGNLPAFSRLSRSPGTGARILRFARNDGQYNGTEYTNLTWTQGRRLSSITKGSQTYSYEYDMSGVRSVKIADGLKHEYVIQNGHVVRDTVTNASTGAFQYMLDFTYDESGHPLTMRRYYNETQTSYNTYHYVLNGQGDVVKLLHGSDTTVAEYSYDAWGNILTVSAVQSDDPTIAAQNPLRYRGYYCDEETGFYYLQSRYYDPAVRRFLNADSYGSTGQGLLGFNMFAYCGNNPCDKADCSGFRPVSLYEHGCTEYSELDSRGNDIGYDANKAVAYAYEYYEASNPRYPNYSRNGGDCTNFVSQCLSAGGIPQSEDWNCYPRPLLWLFCSSNIMWDPTISWTYAPSSYDYVTGTLHRKAIQINNHSDVADTVISNCITSGDLIYFLNSDGDIYHAAIITQVCNGTLRYTQHSGPDINRELTEQRMKNPIIIVHMGG